jgi:hypothetical protein
MMSLVGQNPPCPRAPEMSARAPRAELFRAAPTRQKVLINAADETRALLQRANFGIHCDLCAFLLQKGSQSGLNSRSRRSTD